MNSYGPASEARHLDGLHIQCLRRPVLPSKKIRSREGDFPAPDLFLNCKNIFLGRIIGYARIGVITRETRRFIAAELEMGCDSPKPIVVKRSGATPR